MQEWLCLHKTLRLLKFQFDFEKARPFDRGRSGSLLQNPELALPGFALSDPVRPAASDVDGSPEDVSHREDAREFMRCYGR